MKSRGKKKKIIYPKSKNNYYKRKRKHMEIEGNNEPKPKFEKRLKIPKENNTEKLNINNYIRNHFNIKEEYLLINKEINYKIPIPDENIFLKKEKSYYDNYKIYYNISKHLVIDDNNIYEKKINKDGNCFYNCLSYFFTGEQNYNLFFRYFLYKYVKDFQIEIKNEFSTVPFRDRDIDTTLYIDNIKEDGFFAGDFEISQSIFIFNINIAVYKAKDNDNNYKFIRYYENINTAKEQLPLIILSFDESIQHYQLLIYNTKNVLNNNINEINNISKFNKNINTQYKKETINISYIHNNKINNQINNNNNILELKNEIEKLIKKYKKLSLGHDAEDQFEEKNFKDKIKEGFNFPPYPNHKNGKYLLINIRDYLIKKK